MMNGLVTHDQKVQVQVPVLGLDQAIGNRIAFTNDERTCDTKVQVQVPVLVMVPGTFTRNLYWSLESDSNNNNQPAVAGIRNALS